MRSGPPVLQAGAAIPKAVLPSGLDVGSGTASPGYRNATGPKVLHPTSRVQTNVHPGS